MVSRRAIVRAEVRRAVILDVLTRLRGVAERKPGNEDGPAVFKLSTNAIKGKFSMLNGLFDSQGGVGTGVGSMYLMPSARLHPCSAHKIRAVEPRAQPLCNPNTVYKTQSELAGLRA